ncbi:PRA1 family protein F4 [Cajanus cajan]|uniref:PRA1 family protein n=1 Tax=Cajanus cajan TaxID=3821 RepID=A0A151R699_CAJCA|nr:PRA1 family protein F4 [Cajanus cajan]KYP38016.1 PRA1 family protein F2 [Cajanus cajan]
MVNYGTTQRISTSSTPPSTDADNTYEPKELREKFYRNFRIYCPINIPSTSEAAGVRIMRNMVDFGLYYSLFVWIILFITLIPCRKVSLILLVIMTYVTTLYILLLRAFPNSVVLHRIIDKRAVMALLAVATAVQLILTEAGVHLAVTLASSVPVVLVHAVLWASYDAFVIEDASGSGKGELAPLVGHNGSDADNYSDAV